jgi:hypothetical protein
LTAKKIVSAKIVTRYEEPFIMASFQKEEELHLPLSSESNKYNYLANLV